MLRKSKLLLFSISLILVLGLIQVSISYANDTNTNESDENSIDSIDLTPTIKRLKLGTPKERIKHAQEMNEEFKEKREARITEAMKKKEERLDAARLKICEAREKNIANRLSMMNKRALVIHQGNEKIYQRVDKFYNDKLVPNGYILSNYADLKAEVEANKATVLTLLESAKTSGKEFDCSNEDPKGQADAFKEDMKDLIEANKTYKESIHAFVKAVRDLAKTVTPVATPVPTEGEVN